jgi:hypothetical protein
MLYYRCLFTVFAKINESAAKAVEWNIPMMRNSNIRILEYSNIPMLRNSNIRIFQ